jgi:uncharacterized radical SAM protein YgiQ
MGERPILEIAARLKEGKTVRECRDIRGVAYRLGAKEAAELRQATFDESGKAVTSQIKNEEFRISNEVSQADPSTFEIQHSIFKSVLLPDVDTVSRDTIEFCHMTRIAHHETNPYNAKRLVQFHAAEAVVVNPPAYPLAQVEMDRVYGLPFTRRPHPAYGNEKIPAWDVIKTSVQIMRGCFGGCTFCSITAHEGRIIQSRSQDSVIAEIRKMTAEKDFTGVISDIGGPTANMYEMRCMKPEVEAKCRRLSCVHPTICKLLGTDHGPLVQLMRDARNEPGVRKVLVASGIRMDLARRDPVYMRELAAHHVGGYLKVAPEHTDTNVLNMMKKPSADDFLEFDKEFAKASKAAGKKQYLIPYFIASHPGSDLHAMIDLALFLKRNHYKPDQVQDFIPSPFDIAACMYHTGLDPMTMKPVMIAKHMRDRKLQRALLQFFKPENYFEVRQALEQAGRQDLIGEGCDCLIPSHPPKVAFSERRRRANQDIREQTAGDHIRSKPNGGGRKESRDRSNGSGNPSGGVGYRPGRKGHQRRKKP